MAIYVDPLRTYPTSMIPPKVLKKYGRQWCHMMTDGTSDELHTFARRLGLQQSWVQKDGKPDEHYDLTPAKRKQAIALGAIPVSGREQVRRCILPQLED